MDEQVSAPKPSTSVLDWRSEVFAAFEQAGIELFCYLPDAGLTSFIDKARAHAPGRTVMLTTEEEGVAICCGGWLGGKRGVLMVQSSGVGNCVNAFSLITNCRFPFFLLVTMRGEFGEGNPWQIPMGRTTQQVLELAGFAVYRAGEPHDAVDMVRAGLQMAWRSEAPVAVLLSQRLIGVKDM
jgi:sulfopyruvate decarboxylase alpha subunit